MGVVQSGRRMWYRTQFKTDFNNELKSLLSLKKKQKVPFSVNEVIGISTGEMRGLQPYSAFVDITERNINEKALAQYQGKLSRKIGEIQDIFADRTLSEAEKVNIAQAKADKLKKKLIIRRVVISYSFMN